MRLAAVRGRRRRTRRARRVVSRSTAATDARAGRADRHVGGGLGERGDGGRPTVDVGPRPPVGRDHPGEHVSITVGGDEPAVDPGLVGAVADHRRVGPATDEQLDRLDQHRLAGAGLAGQRRQTRARARARRARSRRGSRCAVRSARRRHSVGQRSARPNLAFRIWW